jgi:hypothetical protein
MAEYLVDVAFFQVFIHDDSPPSCTWHHYEMLFCRNTFGENPPERSRAVLLSLGTGYNLVKVEEMSPTWNPTSTFHLQCRLSLC